MSMSQASALFYGAFLNEDEDQSQDIAKQLINRGVFLDDEGLDDSMMTAHFFEEEPREDYVLPITTEHGVTYDHLYLVNGQPWDDYPLYLVGYPMDSKTLELEEKLYPGIKATVDAELARFAEESGLTLTPGVQLVTSWC